MSLFVPARSKVADEILGLNLEALTPLEALKVLEHLKDAVEKEMGKRG